MQISLRKPYITEEFLLDTIGLPSFSTNLPVDGQVYKPYTPAMTKEMLNSAKKTTEHSRTLLQPGFLVTPLQLSLETVEVTLLSSGLKKGCEMIPSGKGIIDYVTTLIQEGNPAKPLDAAATLDLEKEYHFSARESLEKCLGKHPLLDMPYFQEKGITKAVSTLAAERFADSDKVALGVTVGALFVLEDLQNGEDGFTGKPPVIRMPIDSMLMGLEQALLDCSSK